MAETTYEIQRESDGQFGMVRARLKSLDQAEREVKAMLEESPKHRLRIVERVERVLLLTGE